MPWYYPVALLAIAINPSIHVRGDEIETRDDADVIRFIRACEAGDKIDEWRNASEALFSNPDNDERLEKLSRHLNHSVALRASWQHAANRLGFRYQVQDYREERRSRLSRFFGRLEGRLNLELPFVWEDQIEQTEFFSEDHPLLPVGPVLPKIHWKTPNVGLEYQLRSHGGQPLSDTGVIDSGVSGVWITGDEKLALATTGIDRANLVIPDRGLQINIDLYGYSKMAAVVTNERVFLVSYQDKDSCMVRMWNRNVDTLGIPDRVVIRQLADRAFETVVAYPTLQDDKFVVWIASNGGFCMDAYDARSMTLLATFTTAF